MRFVTSELITLDLGRDMDDLELGQTGVVYLLKDLIVTGPIGKDRMNT